MKSPRTARVLAAFGFIVVMVTMNACARNETPEQEKAREDKIRDDTAKAIERAKPEIKEAGRQLGQAADDAAREARAIAEGVRQGWIRAGHHVVNLNSASNSELMELPDMSGATARKIVKNRPYRDTSELVTKHIVSDAEYSKIKDIVTAQ
jgi:beta-lactam-binding protein with PASTA domain